MITPNDFKNAIGKPDKNFENSVQQALQEVLLDEKRTASQQAKPSRYILPIAAIITVAACVLLAFVTTLGDRPDVVSNSGVMAQPENSSNSPGTLPESITPDHYDLYLSIFNQDITAIYPGYVLNRTNNNSLGNVEWYISNGADEIKVNSVTGGYPYELYGNEFSGFPITMDLYMRSTPEAEAAFMEATQPWLADLFAEGHAYALEMSSISGINYPLNGVTVSILEDGTVKYCDLHFGDRLQVYLSWTRNDDTGNYELTYSYCSDVTETYAELAETTPKPTPQPIATDDLPEEHWMFAGAFGIDINSLYEGYAYTGIEPDNGLNECWMVSNGEEHIEACQVTYGSLMSYNTDIGYQKLTLLHVNFKNDSQAEREYMDMIMENAQPWFSEAYRKTLIMGDPNSVGRYPDSVCLSFDNSGRVHNCEFYYGSQYYHESYIRWSLDYESGAYLPMMASADIAQSDLFIAENMPAESVAEEAELPEQPVVTPEPTPRPIAMDSLPEDHWMLTDTLGIDINSLYPNFTYTGTVTNKSDDKYWMVSNGQDDLIACCVSYGDIINSDIKNGSFACPTLTIYMPIDAKSDKRIHMMMAASAPWLSELYENSRSMFVESYPDIKLNSLEITFDESNTPKFCEMYFGDNCEFYISFMREENSDTFTIIKVYTQPEYEFLDYDDPAEYDTMEVAFEDPALETAIRTALNWEGTLTPAKLAELEKLELSGLSISSLSGIEYCTNLTHLDLYGCGIGNENMKYVASLPSLTTLILHGNDITDITNLSGLELTFLQLSNNRISNLWPLSGMTSLRVLMLDDNQLSGEGSLKPLESLSNLEKLYLQRCGITDVYPIAELAEHGCLKTLDLSENPIEDLSPIEGLELPELFYNK